MKHRAGDDLYRSCNQIGASVNDPYCKSDPPWVTVSAVLDRSECENCL